MSYEKEGAQVFRRCWRVFSFALAVTAAALAFVARTVNDILDEKLA